MSFLLSSLDDTRRNLLTEEVQNDSLEETFDDPWTSKSIRDNLVDNTNNDKVLLNENLLVSI